MGSIPVRDQIRTNRKKNDAEIIIIACRLTRENSHNNLHAKVITDKQNAPNDVFVDNFEVF